MAFEVIDVGLAPDDGNGDILRDAFIVVNTNYQSIAIHQGNYVDKATADAAVAGGVPANTIYSATTDEGDWLVAYATETEYTIYGSSSVGVTAAEVFTRPTEYVDKATADAAIAGGVPAGETYLATTVSDELLVANATETSYTVVNKAERLLKKSTLVFAAALAVNFDSGVGRVKQVTLTGNVTSSTFSATDPGPCYLIIVQDGSGGHTFAFPAGLLGPALSIDTDPDAITIVQIFYDGTNFHV